MSFRRMKRSVIAAAVITALCAPTLAVGAQNVTLGDLTGGPSVTAFRGKPAPPPPPPNKKKPKPPKKAKKPKPKPHKPAKKPAPPRPNRPMPPPPPHR